MKRLLYLLTLVATMATSCKTKQKTVEREEVTTERTEHTEERQRDSVATVERVTDTVYVEVTKPQDQRIEIDNPCDSVTGLLNDINLRAGKTTVTTSRNKLLINTACDGCESRFEKHKRQWSREKSRLIEKSDSTASFYQANYMKTSEVEKRPWWSWLAFWIGLAIPVIVLIILKLR